MVSHECIRRISCLLPMMCALLIGCTPTSQLRPDSIVRGQSIPPLFAETSKSAGLSTDDNSVGSTDFAMKRDPINLAQGQSYIPLPRAGPIPLPKEGIRLVSGSMPSDEGPWRGQAPIPKQEGFAADAESRNVAVLPIPKSSELPKIAEQPKNPMNGTAIVAKNPPLIPSGPVVAMNPQNRFEPTASGERLSLAPHETAIQRAVELSQQLALTEAENKMLLKRVKQLELDLETREKSLAELLRETEQATAELIRARTDIQSLRKEITAVRRRLEQVEKEDLETLRAVIAAMEKLLDATVPKTPVPK